MRFAPLNSNAQISTRTSFLPVSVSPQNPSIYLVRWTSARSAGPAWPALVMLLSGWCSTAAGADLLSVLQLAQPSDPIYQSAGAANRAAQEARPQARAALLPVIQATGSSTGNEVDVRESSSLSTQGRRNFNSNSWEISLTQPIYRQDLYIQLGQADSRIRQSDMEFAFARQALVVRVADAYFAVLRAHDTLRFAQATLEAFGQQLTQSQQRFEVGLIAITDVEEAQAGFDLARAQVIEAENDLDNTREALREITGEYHTDLATLSSAIPLTVPQPDDIDRWTETALANNLELASARHASETARDEIKRVSAGHLPSVDLVGRHGRDNSNGGTFGGSRTWNSSLTLQLNIPIYAGGSIVSRTRESRHLYQQSLDDLESLRRSTQRATRNAFLGVQSGISRVNALRQAVRSSESAVAAIDAGFQVGTRTSVDVLDAQRNLFLAKRDFSAARYQYILDVLRLKQAAGTLTEDDLVQVNSWLD